MDIYSKLNLWWICLHKNVNTCDVCLKKINIYCHRSFSAASTKSTYHTYVMNDMICILIYAEIVSCSCYSLSCSAPSIAHLHFRVASRPAIWWCFLTMPACMNWPDGGEHQIKLNDQMYLKAWLQTILQIYVSCLFHTSICNLSHLDYGGGERRVSLNKTDFKAHTIYMTFRSFIMSSPILPTSLIETSYWYLAAWKKHPQGHHSITPACTLGSNCSCNSFGWRSINWRGKLVGAWIACQYQHPEN